METTKKNSSSGIQGKFSLQLPYVDSKRLILFKRACFYHFKISIYFVFKYPNTGNPLYISLLYLSLKVLSLINYPIFDKRHKKRRITGNKGRIFLSDKRSISAKTNQDGYRRLPVRYFVLLLRLFQYLILTFFEINFFCKQEVF